MAQQTNVFAKDHTEPVLTMKCIFMLGGICVLIAGAAYYAGSNKRGRMQNNSNTSGNTPS